jgi:AcrR family transcriptional regulator
MPMVDNPPSRAARPGGVGGAERPASGRRDSYTVESLLAVTVGVFNDRGYDGTSMEDLARAAGISKSSIYHHVRSKEELLRLAVGRALDGLFAILDEPAAREGRSVDRLEHVVRRTTEVLLSELPYVTLLLRVRGNTAAEQWALSRRRDFDHRVADLVRAAAEAGDLRADIRPRLATRLLFGMVNSIAEWYHPAGETAAADIADAVVLLAFAGLRRTP